MWDAVVGGCSVLSSVTDSLTVVFVLRTKGNFSSPGEATGWRARSF